MPAVTTCREGKQTEGFGHEPRPEGSRKAPKPDAANRCESANFGSRASTAAGRPNRRAGKGNVSGAVGNSDSHSFVRQSACRKPQQGLAPGARLAALAPNCRRAPASGRSKSRLRPAPHTAWRPRVLRGSRRRRCERSARSSGRPNAFPADRPPRRACALTAGRNPP